MAESIRKNNIGAHAQGHRVIMVALCQGDHTLWKTRKTGKMVKKFPAGKNQGIWNFAENQGKIGEFQKILSL